MPEIASPNSNITRDGTPLAFPSLSREMGGKIHVMVGIGKPQKPNRRFVGDAMRLPAKTIPRFGSVTVKWPGNIASASLTRLSPSRAVISMAGDEATEIGLTEQPMPFGRRRSRAAVRLYLICPRCQALRNAAHFVNGEWGCRGCLDLAYASRHRQRYCTAIARRARLLRKLARVSPQGLRARWFRAQIAREESVMLAHLKQVSRDLRKRSKRDA